MWLALEIKLVSSKSRGFFSVSLQSVTTVSNHKPKTGSEESEAASVQEQKGIIASFELAAQSSKGNQATAGMEKSLTKTKVTRDI